MSSDTDKCSSNSSSSAEERKRKHKKSKKSKRKSEKKPKKDKKEKRHKTSKRARKDASSDEKSTSPRVVHSTVTNIENAGVYGPALPPHLLKRLDDEKEQLEEAKPQPIIGPIIPSDFKEASNTSLNDEAPEVGTQNPINIRRSSNSSLTAEDDLQNAYGPLPNTSTTELNAAQVELEERALQLKMAALDGSSITKINEQAEREEWMLELPEVGLKSGLAALANMKRTFHQGKEKPDFSDRSAWTKTPQSAEATSQKTANLVKKTEEELKSTAQATYDKERDAEQERIAKKHKKKHKREESLVELHQKKLRKEQKEKEKELAASGSKPERRPFSREVDLKLNKIDSNQTKQIVDKAKILNTKFSSGHTKYL